MQISRHAHDASRPLFLKVEKGPHGCSGISGHLQIPPAADRLIVQHTLSHHGTFPIARASLGADHFLIGKRRGNLQFQMLPEQ